MEPNQQNKGAKYDQRHGNKEQTGSDQRGGGREVTGQRRGRGESGGGNRDNCNWPTIKTDFKKRVTHIKNDITDLIF